MTIIAVAANKGGVGKTTTSVSLAAGLANLGKVLLVDGDSQGHISLSFGLPVRSGLFDWLVRDLPLQDCTLTGRPVALTLLPGDSLTKTVERLYSATDEFVRLVEKLRLLAAGSWQQARNPAGGSPLGAQPTASSPFVIFDTAAGGLFQEAALAAADQIVVPFRAETLGIDSMFQTLELIRQLAPSSPTTLLPTAFDTRLSEQKENLQRVVNEFGEGYGLSRDWDAYVIRNRVAVAQCVSYGKTIYEYNQQGIKDVRRGYTTLINRVVALAERERVEEGKVLNGNVN